MKNIEINDYLLHYRKGIKMEYSNGIIKNKSEDNYNIYHLCDWRFIRNPIINSMNCQMIVIYKSGAEGQIIIILVFFLRNHKSLMMKEIKKKKKIIIIKKNI